MKKLLALVLCVMMFVAIIPTAAFAEWPDAWKSAKAVSDAKANIEYLYGTLAADTTVFESIKSVDSILSNMAKSMFEGTDKYDIETRDGKGYYRLYNGDLVNNAKAILRANIGEAITDYMDDHASAWQKITKTVIDPVVAAQVNPATGKNYSGKIVFTGLDGAWGTKVYASADNANLFYYYHPGQNKWWYTNASSAEAAAANNSNWTELTYNPTIKVESQSDPVKYINTFATAVSKAFTSKDGAAAIERIYYDLALAKLSADMQDKFDDLQADIEAWEGTDALLAAYGFNAAGNWDPYAFINPDDLPKGLDSYTNGVLAFDPLSTPYYLYD